MAISRLPGTKGDGTQISADDINDARNVAPGTELKFGDVGFLFGVSFGQSDPLEMDEFKGKRPGDNATFGYFMAGVTGFSVDARTGNVTAPTAAVGTITNLSYSTGFSSGKYSTVTSNTERTVTVSIRVPGGYANANAIVTGVETVTQAPPLFTYADAGVSGFAVNRQTGAVTAPTATSGTITNRSYSTGYSNGFYPTVSSLTTRTVTVTVKAPSGWSNTNGLVSGTESAQQLSFIKPEFTDANITITGFAVNEFGQISVPTVTASGLTFTVTYTTAANSGTAVTAAAGFPIVGVSTFRYCNVSVTVPDSYSNPGPYTKWVRDLQEERIYGTNNISITGFSVDSNGDITAPSVSATGVAAGDITVTYSTSENSGFVTLAKGFVPSLTDVPRWVNASVTVPAGYSNSNTTLTRSLSTTQSAASFIGYIYIPYNSTNTADDNLKLGTGGIYTQNNFWTDSDTAAKTITIGVRSNVSVNYNVDKVTGNIVLRAVGSTSTVGVGDLDIITQTDKSSPPELQHFQLYATAPSAGGSRSINLNFTSNNGGQPTELQIVLNRASSTPTVGTVGTVDTNPTVKLGPVQ